MPIPTVDRVIYDRNVLEVVICQLRFPPILPISEGLPAQFQNAVRTTFPDYQKTISGGIALPEGAPVQLQRLFTEGLAPPEHRFLVEGGKQFLVLHQNFIALNDSEYTNWEHFTELLLVGRQALLNEYEPANYSRVGLRYLDLISREVLGLGDEPWSNLIRSPLLGASSDDEIGDVVSLYTGKFLVEVSSVPNAVGSVTYGRELISEDGGKDQERFRIDIDFHVNGSMPDGEIEGIIDAFHEEIRGIFRWSITDRLHDVMGPKSPR